MSVNFSPSLVVFQWSCTNVSQWYILFYTMKTVGMEIFSYGASRTRDVAIPCSSWVIYKGISRVPDKVFNDSHFLVVVQMTIDMKYSYLYIFTILVHSVKYYINMLF